MIVSESDAGTRFDLSLGPRRQAYLICIEGGSRVRVWGCARVGGGIAMRDVGVPEESWMRHLCQAEG